jgi:hypothetical protein
VVLYASGIFIDCGFFQFFSVFVVVVVAHSCYGWPTTLLGYLPTCFYETFFSLFCKNRVFLEKMIYFAENLRFI